MPILEIIPQWKEKVVKDRDMNFLYGPFCYLAMCLNTVSLTSNEILSDVRNTVT
jgi:hypothetical protein